MLSLEKFRAHVGLIAVAALAFSAAAGVLLVLLESRPARIVVAAASFAVAVALVVLLGRRARRVERGRHAELKTAETRHRALLDGLPLVTWLTASGDYSETLYVAPGIADLTGYAPAEWAEEPELAERLLHPDDREQVLSRRAEAASGTPVSVDYRLLARDGRAVWIREDSATVRDPRG